MKLPTWVKLLGISTIMLLSLIFLFLDKDNLSEAWKLSIAVVGIVTSYFQYIYKNSQAVFLLCNKAYRYAFNNTVSWESSYKFFIDEDENNVEKFKSSLESFFSQLSGTKNITSIKKIGGKDTFHGVRYKYKGRERILNITLTEHTTTPYVILKYSSSLAYRESVKEFSEFEEILSLFLKNFIEKTTAQKNSFYVVKIAFENWNPFYKMIVSHFDSSDIESYTLEIKDSESRIIIKNNELEVSTNSKEYIENAIKEYIVLSTVG